MTKCTDVINMLSNTPGHESVGYAAADVNTAMIAAKFIADEHFGEGSSMDPQITLNLVEIIMNRVPTMEAILQEPDEGDESGDESGDEGADGDPVVEVMP